MRTINLARCGALLVFLVTALVVAAPGGAVAGNLVVNGSFENGYPGDGICGGWWYEVGYDCNPSNDSIPGWTQVGGGVDWHNIGPNPGEPAAEDGRYTIDLVGSSDAGAIAQDVPTTPGGYYVLEFAYAGHPYCIASNGTGTASALATAGGASVTVTSGPTNTYTLVSLPFRATNATTTIEFASLTAFGCGGVLIDDVHVLQTAPPRPTTKDQCTNGGWQSYGVFKNQGDCVSYVATGGTNQPAG
jgi:hypothetical protein